MFADMIVYIENPNESKKIIELLRKLSKIAEYKINIQKSIIFLNTNNEHEEIKSKNTIPLQSLQKLLR